MRFKTFLSDLIFDALTKGDRNIEKGTVTNLLSELRDCLNGNRDIEELLTDFQTNLKYHNRDNTFYYEEGNQRTYSADPKFREQVVDTKIDAIDFNLDELPYIDQVRLQIVIQYYDDIIKGFSNREHLAPLIKRLDKRIEDLKKVVEVEDEQNYGETKNITVVSLKDVNIHMKKILPLLLCKALYDRKKSENDDRSYLNLIIDEAHNILSEESERESEHWKDYRLETFEEIIKEGRKFGVFLTVASQRPADISPTIISQLHNYFVHRLINDEDIRAVEKTISYLDKVSFGYLPILPTGTCILAGLLANVPVVVDIGAIDERYEPKNKTITLVDKWS